MGKSAEYDAGVFCPLLLVLVRALRPAHGPLHRLVRGFVASGVGEALVQRHHDVAAQGELDVDGGFRREQMRVAIQVRAEEHALVGDLAEVAQAEDLESAGVGEDGARPGHEFVQPAELADQLVAGPQEQVIGVGEDDLGVELAGQIALHDAFDRGLRADGHEDGRFDDAVRGVDQTGASAGVGADGLEFEAHYFTVREREDFRLLAAALRRARDSPSAPEDCCHDARTATPMHDSDNPQRPRLRCVGNSRRTSG